MIITLTTTNQDFIDDMLAIADNRFDFEELEITNDTDKVKHLISFLIKNEVNNLRRRQAVSQVQFTDATNESL